MKGLIRLLMNDLEEEKFSYSDYVIYGVVYPTCLVVGCVIASVIA